MRSHTQDASQMLRDPRVARTNGKRGRCSGGDNGFSQARRYLEALYLGLLAPIFTVALLAPMIAPSGAIFSKATVGWLAPMAMTAGIQEGTMDSVKLTNI
jgi:hypothetical protein